MHPVCTQVVKDLQSALQQDRITLEVNRLGGVESEEGSTMDGSQGRLAMQQDIVQKEWAGLTPSWITYQSDYQLII